MLKKHRYRSLCMRGWLVRSEKQSCFWHSQAPSGLPVLVRSLPFKLWDSQGLQGEQVNALRSMFCGMGVTDLGLQVQRREECTEM